LEERAEESKPRTGASDRIRDSWSALALSLFDNEPSKAKGEAEAAFWLSKDRLRNREQDALMAGSEDTARRSLWHSGAP